MLVLGIMLSTLLMMMLSDCSTMFTLHFTLQHYDDHGDDDDDYHDDI